jgi:cell division GTPase FtsZ
MYNTVATALQKTRYPDIRKFYATAWAYRMQLQAERNSPQLATTLDTANSYLVNALADQSMPLSEAEEGCDFLFSSDLWSEPAAWKSYQALEQF